MGVSPVFTKSVRLPDPKLWSHTTKKCAYIQIFLPIRASSIETTWGFHLFLLNLWDFQIKNYKTTHQKTCVYQNIFIHKGCYHWNYKTSCPQNSGISDKLSASAGTTGTIGNTGNTGTTSTTATTVTSFFQVWAFHKCFTNVSQMFPK